MPQETIQDKQIHIEFEEKNPSFTPYNGYNKPKFYGRFNQGVVTLNLVDVACSSDGNEEEFWKILDERLKLCYRALMARHRRLLGTPSDVAPILWQNGAIARLQKGEKIDKLLYNNYSTISLNNMSNYHAICFLLVPCLSFLI